MTLPVILELVIDVLGIPAPQGSKAYKGLRNGKPILAESSKKVKPWRDAVERHARAAIALAHWQPLDGPIELVVTFLMPRGKTITRDWPTTYPDSSKLIRSTEDALVRAGVLVDDARIVHHDVWKQYTTGEPGARVKVRSIA
jgi:Holliday junction resolvase RusA-like endonuclease